MMSSSSSQVLTLDQEYLRKLKELSSAQRLHDVQWCYKESYLQQQEKFAGLIQLADEKIQEYTTALNAVRARVDELEKLAERDSSQLTDLVEGLQQTADSARTMHDDLDIELKKVKPLNRERVEILKGERLKFGGWEAMFRDTALRLSTTDAKRNGHERSSSDFSSHNTIDLGQLKLLSDAVSHGKDSASSSSAAASSSSSVSSCSSSSSKTTPINYLGKLQAALKELCRIQGLLKAEVRKKEECIQQINLLNTRIKWADTQINSYLKKINTCSARMNEMEKELAKRDQSDLATLVIDIQQAANSAKRACDTIKAKLTSKNASDRKRLLLQDLASYGLDAGIFNGAALRLQSGYKKRGHTRITSDFSGIDSEQLRRLSKEAARTDVLPSSSSISSSSSSTLNVLTTDVTPLESSSSVSSSSSAVSSAPKTTVALGSSQRRVSHSRSASMDGKHRLMLFSFSQLANPESNTDASASSSTYTVLSSNDELPTIPELLTPSCKTSGKKHFDFKA